MTACTLPTDADIQACDGMPPPASGVLIDFSTYQTNGNWGAGDQLTGGTSKYHNNADCHSTDLVLTADGGTLHMTGSIPPSQYAGDVFWFGPCVNAASFGGVSLSVMGDTGGGTLKVQVQTALDYPIDISNRKGACVFTNCDNKWSECAPPTASVTVTADMATVDLPWASFSGGSPNGAVTPEGLVGLQIQFECPLATDCPIDVTLGAINFLPPS